MKPTKKHLIMLVAVSLLTIIAAAIKTQTSLALSRVEATMATKQVSGNTAEFVAKSEALQSANQIVGVVLAGLVLLTVAAIVQAIVVEVRAKTNAAAAPQNTPNPE